MKITVTREHDGPTTKQYPWLGIRGDLVVEFFGPAAGVVRHPSDSDLIGYYDINWDEGRFVPWNGQLTIEN